jgi:MerR family transcriptional regulator, mercuric resistance operon regulatory protein
VTNEPNGGIAEARAGGAARSPKLNPRQGAHLVAKLTEVEARIADLHVIAATLRSATEAGCGDLTACASSS